MALEGGSAELGGHRSSDDKGRSDRASSSERIEVEFTRTWSSVVQRFNSGTAAKSVQSGASYCNVVQRTAKEDEEVGKWAGCT